MENSEHPNLVSSSPRGGSCDESHGSFSRHLDFADLADLSVISNDPFQCTSQSVHGASVHDSGLPGSPMSPMSLPASPMSLGSWEHESSMNGSSLSLGSWKQGGSPLQPPLQHDSSTNYSSLQPSATSSPRAGGSKREGGSHNHGASAIVRMSPSDSVGVLLVFCAALLR